MDAPLAPPSTAMVLWQRLNALSSKPPMVVYLGALLVLSAWGIGNGTLIGRGLLVLAIYSLLDLVAGYVREGRWIVPSSAWVSGLILGLVLSPTAPRLAVFLAPVLASASKHLLRVRRKHVFNPAAFALLALGYLYPDRGIVSWWGEAWGILPWIFITLSGIVTVVRVKRWRTALVFLVVYLVGTAVLLSRSGTLLDLRTLLVDGTLAFFATVMLIEPVTTAYHPVALRVWFGAAVGVLALLLALPGVPLPVPDTFLTALLLGNLGTTIASRLLRK